ncbi:DUF885 domain-containing protein [Sphingomonas ginkgonis]|uniref:DUF885 domain-containing protein n=1 Tax=Sphingomonas ginkgonis TaxID=2315330 RepID=A0A429V7U6_9SPHN|nr:DUF885 domain-containing protein [Sphingomonas ginkgonis]RST30041.1 DUF885 domain-containing protein [Sphingomonas ginkgonis]
MTVKLRALLLASALSLGTAAAAAPAAAPRSAATAASAHAQLFALFQRSDEAQLRRNPIQAIYRGDLRYADRLGDSITDAYYAGEKTANQSDLAALHRIPRTRLNATDQLAYDVFEYQLKDALRGYSPDLLFLQEVRPMNHFYGLHKDYATFASGQGAAPFKTLADYENNLKRHRDFTTYIDRAIGRWKQGEAAGVVDTKLTVRNMIEQLDNQLKIAPEESSFYQPVKTFPAGIGAADRTRLAGEYRAAITGELYPALTRMRDFLRDDYLSHAREGVGLMYMKGGPALYRYLVQSTTTLPLQPEEVHQLGLKEVARITAEFDKVRQEVGFKGTLPQFFDYMRTAPQFQPKSRDGIRDDYFALKTKVEAQVPRFFSTVPRSPLQIRAYEPFREKFEAGGSYEQGTPDGSRPGTFYYNAYDLPSRSTWEETTLFLHEGEPGHHFQISLAQENDQLPPFMRFGGNTAYVEGWALYSETLGYDMGFYKDPYQRFGTLNDEMLRAMRLVVDTGIHSKGWTRDQSIAYMLSHSGMGKSDATAEVERYIAIPSQALAYKIGALTIQRLRDKAKAALGPKFDIREFHAQVLMTGALPLQILEQKIDRWIAERKAA